jgi:phage protein D
MSLPRSTPVFYVQLRGASPRLSVAQQATLDVARCDKQLADLAAKLTAAEKQAEIDGSTAVVDAVQNSIASWEKRKIAAQAVLASTGDQPPPVEDIDEEAAVDDITGRVMSFSYEDSEKKTDLVKLTMDNRDLVLFDSPLLEKDALLIVAWGYPGNMAPPREAVVQSVKGATQLTVEAQDKGVLLHKVSVSRTFDNLTRSQVVARIAKEHGFGSERRDIQDTEITYESIVQSAQTDAQFLKKLADQEGFEFYVDRDGLHWHERRLDQKPVRSLQYFLPPDVGDVLSFNLDNDINAKPGKVVVRGRNPITHKDVEEVADDGTVDRTTLASTPEILASPEPVEVFNPETLESNVETYHDSPTRRHSARADAGTPGRAPPPAATGSAAVVPTTETGNKAAKREASGMFKRTQQSAVQLTLKIIGDPQIDAKSIVEVRGLGVRFSGKYYVSSSKHTISSSGYTQELKTKTEGTNKGGGKAGTSATKPDTAATPNTQDAEQPKAGDIDPPPLTSVEVVDPETLETRVEYHNVPDGVRKRAG